MDVTFRKSESYLNPNPIPLHGESKKEEVIPSLLTLDSYIQMENSSSEGLPQGDNVRRLDKPNLKWYSRKNKTKKNRW